jgi:hypothetical protein
MNGYLYAIDEDGSIRREDELLDSDLNSGRAVFVSDVGEAFTAYGEDLYELSDEMAQLDLTPLIEDAAAQASAYAEPEDDDELSEAGQQLLQTFLDRNNGDGAAAALEANEYIAALEHTEAGEFPQAAAEEYEPGAEGSEDFLAEWADGHPGAIGNEDFRAMFQQTGDLDQAYALWKRGQDAVDAERPNVGHYDDMDAALDAAYAEGQLGRSNAAAPNPYGSALGNAIDDWHAEQKGSRDLKAVARQRAQHDAYIRAQETRGRA